MSQQQIDDQKVRPAAPRVIAEATRNVPHAWRSIVFGMLATLCAVALLSTSAYLISAASLQPAILTLNAIIVSVRAFAFGRAVFRYLERLDGHNGAFSMMTSLRVIVYERLVPLPLRRLHTYRTTDVVDAIVEDVDAQQDAVVRVREPLWISLGTLCCAMLGVAIISPNAFWWLSASLTLGVLVGAWLPAALGQRSLRTIAAARAAADRALSDAVTHRALYLAYAADSTALDVAAAADAEYSRHDRRATMLTSMAQAIVLASVGLAIGTGLVQVAHDAMWGAFIGPFIAVIVLIPLAMVESLSLASVAVQHAYRVNASADRLERLIGDVEPMTSTEDEGVSIGVDETANSALVNVQTGLIGWSPEHPVAAPFTASFQPGTTTVIDGVSGAGKSTLALTLAGLLPPLGGKWTLLGHSFSTLDGATIRRYVTLVEQQPYLFNATVAANLRVGATEATDAELWTMLDTVGLRRALQTREGLDTEVGAFGAKLSGGQAQRVALARALLARSPLVILDEPTASVDPEQADALNQALLRAAREAPHHPAVVLLTHHAVPPELVDQRVTVTSALP